MKVVDLPGFGGVAQSEDEHHDIMAQLIVTIYEADILLYCAKVWDEIENTDVEILRLFRMVFGKRLFQHCILVNTFANTIPDPKEIKEKGEGIARDFLVALKKAGIPNIDVEANPGEEYKGIPIIPAGFKEDDENPSNWRQNLLHEIIMKARDNDPYPLRVNGYANAMLKKQLHLTWLMDKTESILSRDPDMGSTMRLECANTKQKVKEKQEEKEKQRKKNNE